MGIPLAASDYLARMQQAIGNADPSTGFTLLDILNESMQHLFTANAWSWRQRDPILMDLVANQSFVLLPPDFGTGGQLDSIEGLWSPLNFVFLTGLNEIARYRGLPLQNFLTYYMALGFPTQANQGVAPAQPVLEIWPTPTSSVTGAFRVVYRSGYVILTDPSQVPNIPPEFSTALTLVARAKTLQYETGSDNPTAIAEWQAASAEIERMKEMDGMSQSDAGHLSPGAASRFMHRRGPGWFRPFGAWPIR